MMVVPPLLPSVPKPPWLPLPALLGLLPLLSPAPVDAADAAGCMRIP